MQDMKKGILISAILSMFLVTSCVENNKKSENANLAKSEESAESVENTGWESQYNRIEATELPDNVVDLISKQWMLVTAGTKDSYNTMTASWGAVGYIWSKPSTFITVRDTRYTYQFLQREESFTLSFFTEEYRGALRICGTKSGRDTDKVAEAGLTPLETPSGLMSFKEARMIIECKKMFVQEMDYAHLTAPYKAEIMEASYNNEPAKHQLFISEITAIWIKK